MIVKREIATVVGKGGVTFVDGRSVRFNNSAEVTKGPELTISALRVGIIGTGQQFNLKRREIEALLTPSAASEVRVSSASDSHQL